MLQAQGSDRLDRPAIIAEGLAAEKAQIPARLLLTVFGPSVLRCLAVAGSDMLFHMSDEAKAKVDYEALPARPDPRAGFRRMDRRLLRVVVWGIGVLLLIFMGIGISQWVATSRTRSQSITVLKQNQNSFAACQAQIDEGVALTLPDKNWLAIRYTCSHCQWGNDVSIAMDSAGGWYQSDKHFCGSFRFLRSMASGNIPASGGWGAALVQAGDLTAARQALLALGFTPMEAPK